MRAAIAVFFVCTISCRVERVRNPDKLQSMEAKKEEAQNQRAEAETQSRAQTTAGAEESSKSLWSSNEEAGVLNKCLAGETRIQPSETFRETCVCFTNRLAETLQYTDYVSDREKQEEKYWAEGLFQSCFHQRSDNSTAHSP